jgi:hypothetical protein
MFMAPSPMGAMARGRCARRVAGVKGARRLAPGRNRQLGRPDRARCDFSLRFLQTGVWQGFPVFQSIETPTERYSNETEGSNTQTTVIRQFTTRRPLSVLVAMRG